MKMLVQYVVKKPKVIRVGPLFCAPGVHMHFDYVAEQTECDYGELDDTVTAIVKAGGVVHAILPVPAEGVPVRVLGEVR
jgi:hypothetical protein